MNQSLGAGFQSVAIYYWSEILSKILNKLVVGKIMFWDVFVLFYVVYF